MRVDPSLYEGVNLRLRLLVDVSNGPFWADLGWNSYGTEGAQSVAKVRLTERRKMA
jgi:hypothetical protein